MKEIELAEKIIDWLSLQHWEIYQEVQFFGRGGVADIVAERHGILWIVETKTAMSIEVLNQASAWPVHFRSIGVPHARRSDKRDYKVAKDYYGVGVIEVDQWGYVHESLRPPLYLKHRKFAKKLLSHLDDRLKTFAKAGSQNGHLTPYRRTVDDIKRTVLQHPGCTIQDLFDIHGRMHYANGTSFKGNVLKCLQSFESDWCRIDTSTKPYRLYIRK